MGDQEVEEEDRVRDCSKDSGTGGSGKSATHRGGDVILFCVRMPR